MSDSTGNLFETRVELPEVLLEMRASRLVGFPRRYQRLFSHLRLLIEVDALRDWCQQYFGANENVSAILAERTPLVIFHGDVGTGKTAVAECCADAVAREMGVEGFLLKLSTRVRGIGHVGEMSTLINDAFAEVVMLAGRHRFVTLIIDEGDAIAFDRSSERAHHEDRVGVNTLIQKIDLARELKGRLLIILCTNRFQSLDPAIVRRASVVEVFERPNKDERRELFQMTLSGMVIDESKLNELLDATGGVMGGPSYTYSDLQTRLLPEAISMAYPNRSITIDDLIEATKSISASPVMRDMNES